MNVNSVYNLALKEVHEYGVSQGWTFPDGTCDMYVTLSNLSDIEEAGDLDDEIRGSFLIVWSGFSKLLAIADGVRATGV